MCDDTHCCSILSDKGGAQRHVPSIHLGGEITSPAYKELTHEAPNFADSLVFQFLFWERGLGILPECIGNRIN